MINTWLMFKRHEKLNHAQMWSLRFIWFEFGPSLGHLWTPQWRTMWPHRDQKCQLLLKTDLSSVSGIITGDEDCSPATTNFSPQSVLLAAYSQIHPQWPLTAIRLRHMRPVIFRLIKVRFKFVSSTRFFSSSSAFLRRHSHEKSSEYLSFSLHPRERQDSPAVRLQANQKRSVLRRLAPQSHLPGCSEVSERHL